ncbi:MAG: 3-dehydroquinate synthase [Bacillus thermozeamaize]|uniref:3-dehydroquinate synthase n=1 Tax=Bacillus thermozeamaize TaxID=230954 RepID=A0A1Y3PQQ7_9BACI|nr:MAG: 3-dehydroquinate synthase [Bacillus thermozeamaize]
MRQLTVSLGKRSYPILIGESLLKSLGDLFRNAGIDRRRKILVVTDQHVASFYLQTVMEQLQSHGYRVYSSIVPAGEQSKSLKIYEQVITQALEYDLDRQSVIVALGGGVVGDLAGFVAATYMRGIAYVQLPTTLLAHDSSVGGKVAVNHVLGKNMIGAFHQPKMVIYDLKALRTLPKREILSGFAEVIKHAAIWDAEFFQWLSEQAHLLLQLRNDLLEDALFRSCQIKAHVVSEDEREAGLRKVLNFGHTVGHALESYYGYRRLAHGEGVAIGMVVASRIGGKLNPEVKAVEEALTELLMRFELPVRIPADADLNKILELIYHDKKVHHGHIHMVLPTKIGQVQIDQVVPPELLIQAMQELQEENPQGLSDPVDEIYAQEGESSR